MNKKLPYIFVLSAFLMLVFAWMVLRFILNYSFHPDAQISEGSATIIATSLLAVFGGGGVILSAAAIYLTILKGNWKTILFSLILFIPVQFLSAIHFIAFLLLSAVI